MSYPRGDTFLIPVQCVREASQTHTDTGPDRRHVRDDEYRFHYGMAGKIQDDMEET